MSDVLNVYSHSQNKSYIQYCLQVSNTELVRRFLLIRRRAVEKLCFIISFVLTNRSNLKCSYEFVECFRVTNEDCGVRLWAVEPCVFRFPNKLVKNLRKGAS
jgi:hypothetical protein